MGLHEVTNPEYLQRRVVTQVAGPKKPLLTSTQEFMMRRDTEKYFKLVIVNFIKN